MELKQALTELRKSTRKFKQTIDLIVNLNGVNVKRDNINIIINIPYKIKDKKVCGFFNEKNPLLDTITKLDFPKYKNKQALKNIVKKYDFFIASAPLMPQVATTFGKVLGPAGKMPSPQLGIITQENEEQIRPLLEKISTSIKIRAQEPSIKIATGNEEMQDEEIIANTIAIYKEIENALPAKKDNVKNVLIKLTMSKPQRIDIK
jgi:large subunit ribosomal protein L1